MRVMNPLLNRSEMELGNKKEGVKMKYEEFIEQRIVSDVAKGRYPKAKVQEIFHTFAEVVCKNTEKAVFEYCWLFCLQTLHYEFGFGQKRLMRFFNEASKAVDAFDAGAFSIEDMRQVLSDDANFECSFNWGDDE